MLGRFGPSPNPPASSHTKPPPNSVHDYGVDSPRDASIKLLKGRMEKTGDEASRAFFQAQLVLLRDEDPSLLPDNPHASL